MNTKTLWMSSIPLVVVLCVIALGFTLVYVLDAEALDCDYLAEKCNDRTAFAAATCKSYGSSSEECLDAQADAGDACWEYADQCQ